MGIKYWSEDIIIVDLPAEPEMSYELENVAEDLNDREGCVVLVDFSDVDVVTAASLSKLSEVHGRAEVLGHRFVFCSICDYTQDILAAAGLDERFEVADDKFDALTTIEMAG